MHIHNEEFMLQTEEIRVGFQTRSGMVQAVNGISLPLYKGRVTAMIGETGSGKSVFGLSLLQLLPGNAHIEGRALYQGRDLLKIPEEEISKIRGRKLALIPQNPDTALNPVLTVGRQLEETGMPKEKIYQTLRSYKLEDPIRICSSYPFQLSGGMKQRILSAMATMQNPDFLIADEPTKGLDPLVRQDVLQLFRNFCSLSKDGPGVLLITHDLLFARALSEQLVVLYAGQIMEEGNTGKVFEEPLHPYTQGFLDAQPYRKLTPIPGVPPSLTNLPKGCPFHPRCLKVMNVCKSVPPDFFTAGDRKVRCHLYA